MAIYWRIQEARVIGDYTIAVRFNDGLEGIVRFLPKFFSGVFSHLIDAEKFKQISVKNGAITWEGELDLAPDAMYHEIKARGGEWVITE